MTDATTTPPEKNVTIRMACDRTGAGSKTVRRWQAKITDNPGHELRSHFDPSPKREKELRKAGSSFTWLFTETAFKDFEQFLERDKAKHRRTPLGGESTVQVAELKSELQYLRSQLEGEREHARKMQEQQLELQKEQSQRQHEFNVLMKQLTEAVASLPAPTQKPEEGSDAATITVPSATPMTGNRRPPFWKRGPSINISFSRA